MRRTKIIAFVFTFLIGITIAVAQNSPDNPVMITPGVKKISLDGEWKFTPANGNLQPASSAPQDVDAKAKELAASTKSNSWSNVKVPQFLNRTSWWLADVSLEYEKEEIKRVAKLPAGTTTAQGGWYSKTIRLQKNTPKSEVYVNFEGVALLSRVYINGVHVGGHLGMFGSFNCRLTPYLKTGQDNQLMVYVERGIKSKEGDKVISVEVSVPVTQNMMQSLNKSMFDKIGPKYNVMGIWLPATLEISRTGGRIADVFFNPSLDGQTIEFTIENPGAATVVGKLSYSIRNKKTGKLLMAETVNPALELETGKTSTIKITKSGLKPELWSPDFPNLYIMNVRWTSLDGKLVHQWKDQVGYRTISTKGTSVLLNGKPYWSRGADMPPYGYKPNDKQVARGFLKYMHDGNTVMTRAHGNPWNNMWFTAADEIGIGVSCEDATWVLLAKGIPPAGNIAAWKKETLEIEKQYRNHPSILFYVVSNEGLPQDENNDPEKLAIYKDVITDMRKIDNSRLIFQTSGNPDNLGIADLEDTHSYWDWYWSSSYVNDYTKSQMGLLNDGRPFLSQEVAVPYSMIDNGSVHPAYIPRYCAQPWVGERGVFGGDYSYFQEHIRAVSKLKAEKLRYSRSVLPTAGFMLFSNVTWIHGALTKPVSKWKPFPVYYGVKQGYQPVLVGLTNTQYVFYEGAIDKTDLFVVNDDTKATDFKNLQALILFKDATGRTLSSMKVPVGDVAYYAVKKLPVQLKIPVITKENTNNASTISVSLLSGQKVISTNSYPVRIIKREAITKTADKVKLVALSGVAPQLTTYLKSAGVNTTELKSLKRKADVIVIGSYDLATTKENVESMLKPGGRVIVLGQGAKAHRFCQEVIASYNDSANTIIDKTPNHENTIQYIQGEYVEMLNYDSTKWLYKGLGLMDWKWWATGNNKPAFVAIASHKIKASNSNVIPIGRYLEPHAYWTGNLDEVYKQKLGYPVFAVNYPWGQVVVCDLIIEGAVDTDPRAGQTILNLLSADIRK
jgi:hypothetical protein